MYASSKYIQEYYVDRKIIWNASSSLVKCLEWHGRLVPKTRKVIEKFSSKNQERKTLSLKFSIWHLYLRAFDYVESYTIKDVRLPKWMCRSQIWYEMRTMSVYDGLIAVQ